MYVLIRAVRAAAALPADSNAAALQLCRLQLSRWLRAADPRQVLLRWVAGPAGLTGLAGLAGDQSCCVLCHVVSDQLHHTGQVLLDMLSHSDCRLMARRTPSHMLIAAVAHIQASAA